MLKAVLRLLLVLTAGIHNNSVASAEDDCFQGTREQARLVGQQRLGLLCQLFCSGCGCKGGPGLRKPNGSCASTRELATGACGEAPSFNKCARECTPLHAGCARGELPTADKPSDQIDRGIKLVEVTGEDKNGRRAAFDILMISDGLNWKYKEESFARNGREVSGADLRKLFEIRFNSAYDVIAIGTASSEGPRSTEERRAQNRGAVLAEMIRSAAPAYAKLWILSLGQHLKKCGQCTQDETATQRPIMVVGVVHRQTRDVDINEALAMAFSRRPDLPQPLEFSRFELTQHR